MKLKKYFSCFFGGEYDVEQLEQPSPSLGIFVEVEEVEEPRPGPSRLMGSGDAAITELTPDVDMKDKPQEKELDKPSTLPTPGRVVNVMVDENVSVREVFNKIIGTFETLGGKYYDKEFPVGPEALFINGEPGLPRDGLTLEQCDDNDKQLGVVKMWLRPAQIFNRDQDGGQFGLEWAVSRNPKPSDIRQGKIGNCTLMSALALLAERQDFFDRILVTKKINSAGAYIINLFDGGRFKDVLVDDRFPCDEYRSLCFGRANRMQLYVPLVEKALAKLGGSYETLIGCRLDDTMTALTGYPTDVIDLAPASTSTELKDEAWKTIVSCFQSKFMMSAATKKADPDNKMNKLGLEPQHAYTVLSVKEDWGPRLIQFRNPWGKGIWKGSYHPYSASWGVAMRKAYRPYMDGSGVFYMEFDDVIKYFFVITVCKVGEDAQEIQ